MATIGNLARETLDLRECGELSVDDAILLDQLEPGVRREYNEIVGKFIEDNGLRGLELLLKPSCRNTLLSNIYKILCRLALLDDYLQRGALPVKILVEDRVTGELVEGLIQARGLTCPELASGPGRGGFVLVARNFLFSIYQVVSDWIGAKWLPQAKPRGPILYIDSFLLPDGLDRSGQFSDRYFTGHERFLSGEELDREWFAPTLVGVRHPWDYWWLGRKLKKATRYFLVQEAWLGLGDYLLAWFLSLRLPFRPKHFPSFRGVALGPLFRQELHSEIASPGLVKAICRYRFIRRLSLASVEICGAVDWHENQVVDRALNLGFRHFYPTVQVKGYQGYIAMGYYAGLQPTCYELERDTLPHRLYVINGHCRDSRLQQCGELDVRVAPAFRFEHLYSLRDRRDRERPLILIALPIMREECIRILEACLSLLEAFHGRARFLVKLHPFFQNKPIVELFPSLLVEGFEQTVDPMPVLLEQTSLVVSTGSSVCVEAVAVGIPVAIYGNRTGVTMNPIPDIVPQELWSIFYTSNQLVNFTRQALGRGVGKSSVESLFHPMDRDGTRELFTCRPCDDENFG